MPDDKTKPIEPVFENPLDHVGDEIPDPWDDVTQEDWPNNEDGDI